MRLYRGMAIVALAAATTGFAQEATMRYDTDERSRTRTTWVDTDHSWCQYKANELSFDFFGTGTVGERTLRRPSLNRVERNGRTGLGIGMEYFFHRNLGIEAEAYTENTDHNFVDNVNGNLIARFPLGDSGVAPYVLGGGGRQFDPVYQWTWDAGAGLEWRFASHVGVFLDGRYVWADDTKDYGLGRVGVRFGF